MLSQRPLILMAPKQTNIRFTLLDITRFGAAMSVVLYHYSDSLSSDNSSFFSIASQFGYLGVPLFFIISGFVISASAMHRSGLAFAVSRFVRLYPAYWASIIITLSVVYVTKGETESLRTFVANLTMLNDYVGIKDIDGVYWTLKVELKFYACVFLLIAFGAYKHYRIWLPAWLLLTVSYVISGQPFFMSWFINPHYSCYFIAGAAFYFIWRDGLTRLMATVLGGSLILSLAKAYQQVSGFISEPSSIERTIAAVIVFGMFLLFAAMTSGVLRLQERPTYLALGALTYPLYLLHARAGKALIESMSEIFPKQIAASLVIFLMIFLSYSVYRLVERPFATPLKINLLRIIAPIEHRLHRS